MSQQININETLAFNATGTTGATNIAAESTTYPWSRGYNDVSYTSNYARIQLNGNSTSTDCYIFYTFSITGIPSDATINSVTASVRVSRNNSVGDSYVQLFNGTTAKGSAVSFSSTSTTGTSVTPTSITSGGTWTINELSNLRVRIVGRRTSTNSTGYFYLWGMTVTVNYSVSGTEYAITSSLATEKIDSISPAGLNYIIEGGNYELMINGSSIDDIAVVDNGVDVTSSLVRHTSPSGSYTFTGIPVSFDSSNSVYNKTAGTNGIYSTNYIENGLTDHTSSTRAALYSVQGSGAVSYMYYNFDCSSIPRNATITSVSCQFKGGTQGSSYYSAYTAQLTSGTTLKGSSTSVTGSNSSPSTVTINGGSSWTRSELDDIKIKFQVTRGSSNTTTDSTWSFFGATLTVNYTVSPENPYYWTYTLTNVHDDHTILVKDTVFIPDEEDPQYNYYSLTVSSANANTDPGRGTIRVVEGSSQTIEIYPLDPSITAILDNGVDVSNLLVTHGGTIPNPSVSSVSGASYGFTLNSNTGYYVSSNTGVNMSAALCRVDFDLPVRCLVTIQYINYAEATYDFGVFGNIDMTLNTSYYPAGSGGATISDSSYMLACNTNAYNTSNAQTLSYNIPAGQHYIYIKYSKDDGTSSNNDTLQWKIQSITPLEPNNYYTYTLNNISASHSLIFIFGDVIYYIVNASCPDGARLFPDGSMVQLPGDYYDLTIVPDDYESSVTATDNGSSVVLEYTEREITKDGVTYTAVNYTYRLSNINALHNIVVTCESHSEELPLFIKVNGDFVRVTHIYRRVNGEWTEVTLEDLADPKVYIYRQ